MAIKNDLLGGVDHSTPQARIKPTDLNDTNDAIIKQNKILPELSVRILQSNDVFVNGPNIAADEMTDTTGTNDTINTGSSTATYESNNNYYVLGATVGTQQNLDSTEYSTTNTSATLVATYSSINSTIFEHRNQIKNDGGGDTTQCDVKFIYSDSTSETVSNTTTSGTYVNKTYTNPEKSKEVSSIEIYIQTTTGGTAYTDENEYYNLTFSSSNTVIADAGTATLDGNELGFVVSCPDSSLPTNTSIDITISDGTNSLTVQTLDSISKNIIVGNPSTLSSGTLKITFELKTTDTSVTPTLPNYGVCILR